MDKNGKMLYWKGKVKSRWVDGVCAGDALASEDSISMIPFQFDLIQLLPKCQQVELFFLTFSTGTTCIFIYFFFYNNVQSNEINIKLAE